MVRSTYVKERIERSNFAPPRGFHHEMFRDATTKLLRNASKVIGNHQNTVLGGYEHAGESRCTPPLSKLPLRPRFLYRTCGYRSKDDIVARCVAVPAGNARANEASWPGKEEEALRNFEKYSSSPPIL